jgi:hypothetical protein
VGERVSGLLKNWDRHLADSFLCRAIWIGAGPIFQRPVSLPL